MSHDPVKDNSTWTHKKEGYAVKVEHSAAQGSTSFRRVVPLIVAGKPVAKLRNKKTKAFLAEFEKPHTTPPVQ